MSETQRTETHGASEMPKYTLASPEFFHLAQKIDQTENALRQKIDQTENALRQEIGILRQEIKQTENALRQEIRDEVSGLRQEIGSLRGEIRNFTWMGFALVLAAISIAVAAIIR